MTKNIILSGYVSEYKNNKLKLMFLKEEDLPLFKSKLINKNNYTFTKDFLKKKKTGFTINTTTETYEQYVQHFVSCHVIVGKNYKLTLTDIEMLDGTFIS